MDMDQNEQFHQVRFQIDVAKQNLKDPSKGVRSDVLNNPLILYSPIPCRVRQVMLKDQTEIRKGDPMFVLDSQSPTSKFNSCLPLHEPSKLAIKKFLEEEDPALVTCAPRSSPIAAKTDDTLVFPKNFVRHKDFASVSDHLFSAMPPPRSDPDWAKKIGEEWSILEKYLPETIFVTVFESRMDLLTSAIVGPKGTPYHDGLFFFDMCFPSNYPTTPPIVRFRSAINTCINPNMSNAGEVNLTLPFTFYERQNLWVPGSSNILQLLVSIQDLILNSRPFINGNCHASLREKVVRCKWSMLYNENIIIKSLQTMVYTINNPPMNFEDLVVMHFRDRAHTILAACKTYMEGNETGCMLIASHHSCSVKFKNDVSSCIKPLVEAFNSIRATVPQEFQNLLPASAPAPTMVGEENVKTGKRKVGDDINEASDANKRRKIGDASASDGMDSAMNIEEIDVYSTRPPITIESYVNIFVSKVLVSDNMKVEKGHPLCVMGSRTMEELLKDISSTAPMVIQNILYANRRSRAGIFSMEVDKKIEDLQLSGMEAFDSKEAVQTRFKNFKNFDYVSDLQNHHFSAQSSVSDQTSPCAENIHKEWKILQKGLPETIYVRVSKLKMNLLRAAIIGPKGTSYRYGLFFVDVCFPGNYPNSPPLVYYHSHGLGISPNIDQSGAVCFQLPKTNDNQDETWWRPESSNVLQLLLIIQNKILNKQPLFNYQPYASMKDTSYGKISSILYNQNILVKSFKTMVYTMNKPPKDFEDFVVGHFCNHVHRILKACNTKSPSATFKNDLGSCQKNLVDAFNRIGAKVPLEFLAAS